MGLFGNQVPLNPLVDDGFPFSNGCWSMEYTLFWDQPICNLIFHQQKLLIVTEKNDIHIRLKIIILWA